MKSVWVQRWVTSHIQLKGVFIFSPVRDLSSSQAGHSLLQVLSQVCYVFDGTLPPRLWVFTWFSETTANKQRNIYQKIITIHFKEWQTLHYKWSHTWKVLDGELAGLGEGNVSTYSSWAGVRVHCPLAVCLGSGKTKCTRDQWGDIIDSELLCI